MRGVRGNGRVERRCSRPTRGVDHVQNQLPCVREIVLQLSCGAPHREAHVGSESKAMFVRDAGHRRLEGRAAIGLPPPGDPDHRIMVAAGILPRPREAAHRQCHVRPNLPVDARWKRRAVNTDVMDGGVRHAAWQPRTAKRQAFRPAPPPGATITVRRQPRSTRLHVGLLVCVTSGDGVCVASTWLQVRLEALIVEKGGHCLAPRSVARKRQACRRRPRPPRISSRLARSSCGHGRHRATLRLAGWLHAVSLHVDL